MRIIILLIALPIAWVLTFFVKLFDSNNEGISFKELGRELGEIDEEAEKKELAEIERVMNEAKAET